MQNVIFGEMLATPRGIYYLSCEALRQLTPPFATVPIVSHICSNVPLCAFRARCCTVLYYIVFRYVSLIFPFLKRTKKGKRSNNERRNDDGRTFLQRKKYGAALRRPIRRVIDQIDQIESIDAIDSIVSILLSVSSPCWCSRP